MSSLKTALFVCLFASVACAQAVLVGVDTWSPVAKPGDDALLVRFLDARGPKSFDSFSHRDYGSFLASNVS